MIRDHQARAKARKEESGRLAKLAKFDENKVERLNWALLNFMSVHNVEKLETVRFRLRRTVNATAPVELGERFIEFPEELEERFRTVVFKPNLKAIRGRFERRRRAGIGEYLYRIFQKLKPFEAISDDGQTRKIYHVAHRRFTERGSGRSFTADRA